MMHIKYFFPISFLLLAIFQIDQAASQQEKNQSGLYICYPPMEDLLTKTSKKSFSAMSNTIIQQQQKWADQAITNFTKDAHIDSMSVTLFTPTGDPLYQNFTGFVKANDTSSNEVPNGDSLYRIASVTKLFTTLEILRLKDMGALNIDQDISDFIPDFKYPTTTWRQRLGIDKNTTNTEAEKPQTVITVRNLISQTSGLIRDVYKSQPNPFESNEPADLVLADSRQEVLSSISTNPPLNTLSEQYPNYSNLNFILAGYIIEHVYNNTLNNPMSYEEIIQQDILKPLGMNSTYFDIPLESLDRLIVPSGEASTWSDRDLHVSNAALGASSSLNDLRRFAQYILSSYYVSASAAQSIPDIVRPSTLREWLKPHSFFQDTLQSVGSPWEIFTYPYQQNPDPDSFAPRPLIVYTKKGFIEGYHSFFILDPSRQFGAVILISGNPIDATNMVEKFATSFASSIDSIRDDLLTPRTGNYCYGEQNNQGHLQVELVQQSLWITNWTYMGVDMIEKMQLNAIIKSESTTRLPLWPTSEKQIYRSTGGHQPVGHFEGCSTQWIDMGSVTSNDYPVDLLALVDDKAMYPASDLVYNKC